MSITDVRTATEVVIGRVDEIPPGEGRTFVAGDAQVAVFRLRDGSLHATQAACPHAGGPLADGLTDVDVLVCPLHQYAYRWTDGASTNGGGPIRTYPVREADGHVVVEVRGSAGEVRVHERDGLGRRAVRGGHGDLGDVPG